MQLATQCRGEGNMHGLSHVVQVCAEGIPLQRTTKFHHVVQIASTLHSSFVATPRLCTKQACAH